MCTHFCVWNWTREPHFFTLSTCITQQHFPCNKITTSIFLYSRVLTRCFRLLHVTHITCQIFITIFYIIDQTSIAVLVFFCLWCGCCDYCGCNKQEVVNRFFSQNTFNWFRFWRLFWSFRFTWLIDLSSTQMQEQFVPTFSASLIPKWEGIQYIKPSTYYRN